MSPSRSKLLAASALLITFLVGIVIGVIGERVLMIRRGGVPHFPPAQWIVRRLDARLHLSDSQRVQITQIVQRHEDKIRGIWSGVRPAVRSEIDAANSEIDRILTPEQRARFANMRMRLMPRRGDDGMRVRHD